NYFFRFGIYSVVFLTSDITKLCCGYHVALTQHSKAVALPPHSKVVRLPRSLTIALQNPFFTKRRFVNYSVQE
ncbi:MAG: hypothetical protein ACP5TE_14280, partial [Verrucomicrobiia bacterium]